MTLIPPLLSDGARVVLYRRIAITGLFVVAKEMGLSCHRTMGILSILGQSLYQIV